jgi:hypothetical protein
MYLLRNLSGRLSERELGTKTLRPSESRARVNLGYSMEVMLLCRLPRVNQAKPVRRPRTICGSKESGGLIDQAVVDGVQSEFKPI